MPGEGEAYARSGTKYTCRFNRFLTERPYNIGINEFKTTYSCFGSIAKSDFILNGHWPMAIVCSQN